MNYNQSVLQGDTWAGITVEFLIDNAPVDLTGASILLQLRKTFCDRVVALEFSTEDGSILIDNPASGRFSIEPTIIDISPRQYVYDVQVTLASGRVVTILEGTFTVTPTVSR